MLQQLLKLYIAILNMHEVSSSLDMKTNLRMRKELLSAAFTRDEYPLDPHRTAIILQKAVEILTAPLVKTGLSYQIKMKEELPVPIVNILIGMGLLSEVASLRRCSLSYQTPLPIPRVTAGPNPSDHILLAQITLYFCSLIIHMYYTRYFVLFTTSLSLAIEFMDL